MTCGQQSVTSSSVLDENYAMKASQDTPNLPVLNISPRFQSLHVCIADIQLDLTSNQPFCASPLPEQTDCNHCTRKLKDFARTVRYLCDPATLPQGTATQTQRRLSTASYPSTSMPLNLHALATAHRNQATSALSGCAFL
jgi:hypothetical protein